MIEQSRQDNSYLDLTSAFANIYSFCEARNLPISDLIRFWRRTFPADSRVCLFATTGAGVAALFESLSGIQVTDKQMQDWICEAGPSSPGRAVLFADGSIQALKDSPCAEAEQFKDKGPAVLILNGGYSDKTLISIAMCGIVQSNPLRMQPESWLERVALAVIVTPATAALGKLEVDMIRRLLKKRREVAVVIRGIGSETENESNALIREIEEFKLQPLRKEIGQFYTLNDAMDGSASLKQLSAKLQNWIKIKLDIEKQRQLSLVVSEWLAAVDTVIKEKIVEDNKRSARLNYVSTHLKEHLAHLDDIVLQECLREINHLRSIFDSLKDECGRASRKFSEWTAEPKGDWRDSLGDLLRLWRSLENEIRTAPQVISEKLNNYIRTLSGEFYSAYADVLSGIAHSEVRLENTGHEMSLSRQLLTGANRFQEVIEKKASEQVSLRRPEMIDQNEKTRFPRYENDKRSADGIRGFAERALMKFDPGRVEREMLDAMLAFLEIRIKPLMLRCVELITSDIARQLAGQVQRVIDRSARQVNEQINQNRERLIWENARADFRKLQDEWESLTTGFAAK